MGNLYFTSTTTVSIHKIISLREPNVWPAENDFPGSRNFKPLLSNGFQLRLKLARKLVEEIAGALEYSEFVEKFKEAEFSSFYLKKYTERKAK